MVERGTVKEGTCKYVPTEVEPRDSTDDVGVSTVVGAELEGMTDGIALVVDVLHK